MARASRHGFIAPAIVTGWLLTLAELGYRVATQQLSADPVATSINQLGLLALVLLVASLCATPLKLLFSWTWPLRVRRTLGLLAFFTALLHFLIYALDHGFDLGSVLDDVGKRSFILNGFLALLLLVPLALTSSKRAVARLGFPAWQRLHRLVYAVAVLASVHYYQRVKADHTQPLIYAAVLAAGFGIRLFAWRAKSSAARRRRRAA